ncbi:type VI secretion system tip protein VgrG [Candidatus Cardinium sp. TP]|uniref:type VI secretion system tip protein VgrG n=1 Tax=Candidatus Cardinium sp. TP TaxID=2961955 RepID=UPI0021B02CFD|nr:type VI secretion system tip protein VgrG [Candidatus Cardinium sp. TP]MCT4697164.1 type VI secretion system tip protein VgrG [Candidatus Cardinium sp. TP]MDN5247157.1 type VI secretion system tip protein VgrG [Candidatus Cardinium sp.]
MATAFSGDFIKYAIKVGSKTLDASYPIQSIMVDKRINKIPYAKIVLHDGSIQSQTFSIANDKTFTIGATVTIRAGYGDGLEQLFEGVVAKLAIQSRSTGWSTLTVTCRDAAYKTTLAPKTKHFVKSKDSDLLKKILGSYSGLSHKIEATTIVHENITQHEISDWDFLNIRAEANGQVVVVNDGTLTVKKPKATGKGAFTYTYGADFIDFDAEIDAKNPWSAVTALSWDSNKQNKITEQANDPGEQSMGDISYKKLTTAAQPGNVAISHGGVLDPSEIKTLATGLLNRSRIAKIKGSVTVSGNAALRHDGLITIEKGASHFAGNAYVSGVQHIISDGNWQTILTLGLEAQRYMYQYRDIGALPAAGMMPPIYGLQLGIVKQITQDPQKQNRILVHLPLVQDKPKEGMWCRLASFYATQASGSFFIPELEDEVVVGFVNDDIRFPIILGSLYSNKHVPPKTIDPKNSFKSFISKEKLEFSFHDDKEGPEIIIKTPKGGLIQISDKKKSIEMVDQNGNKVVLSNDGINLTSSKDINLNARASITIKSGKDVVINGTQNINLKSMNINAQASMKAILSGNASTEVKSGMATIIKGTTVLIN